MSRDGWAPGDERTGATNSVFGLLRGRGLDVDRVVHGEDASHVVRVSLRSPPRPEQTNEARALVRRFAGESTEWIENGDEVEIRFGDVEPADYFELLGVARRELSYNALLGSGLRHSESFRTSFLRKLELPSTAQDWRCDTHVPAPDGLFAKVDQKQRKSIPDVVMWSKSEDTLVIVENKVEALEGHRQTERYAHPEFLKAVAKRCRLKQPQFRLVFLTPDGVAPSHAKFVPLGYGALLECLPVPVPDGRAQPIDRLLECLASRIREMVEWPAPGEDSFVAEYLQSHLGLVSPRRVFKNVIDRVGPSALPRVLHGVSNNANGPIFWAHWFRDGWTRVPPTKGAFGDQVHVELQWSPDIGALRVLLHHEIHPYRTHTALKADTALCNQHRQAHQQHFARLTAAKPSLTKAGWLLARGKWALASCAFDQALRVKDLRTRLQQLADAAVGAIER